MSTTAETKKSVVAPFAIEVDTETNQDWIISSIPGCRLRGRLDHRRRLTPEYIKALGQCPTVPGQHLHVFPSECRWRIEDPLYGDRQLCEELKRGINFQPGVMVKQIEGIESTEGTIDQHRMKTLCRELLQMAERGVVKIVKGPTPKMEDIDALPGHYLLNPGLQTPWNLPKFEKDYEKWYEGLVQGGG